MPRLRNLFSEAASFLLLADPITGQECWAEVQGISPSTLVALTTAMICAAETAESAEHKEEQAFVEAYADWLEFETRKLDSDSQWRGYN